jgi:hypothetical protein
MTAKSLPQAPGERTNANYLQADQNIATKRGHLIPLPRP